MHIRSEGRSLGQVAFDAYSMRLGWVEGDPSWSEITPSAREAFEDAAKAVMGALPLDVPNFLRCRDLAARKHPDGTICAEKEISE